MDLDAMKSNWDKAGEAGKTRSELLKMTQIKNHPHIKRTKTRFLAEGLALVVFTLFYYDGLDGDQKPAWLNMLLVGSALVYILNRYWGWYTLRNPVSQVNLKQSLAGFESRLKWIALSTLITSLLFGFALLAFFASVIHFTKGKYLLLIVMLLVLILFTCWSGQIWLKRIRSIKALLSDFD